MDESHLKETKQPCVVYHGTHVDWKYQKIIEEIRIDYKPISGLAIFRTILFQRDCRKLTHLHLRYLINYGYVSTIVFYVSMIFLAKIKGVRVVWTCHNIYEHNTWHKRFNDVIRKIMVFLSDDIIVFHQSLIKYLGYTGRANLHVACFGDYKEFLELPTHSSNEDFTKGYSTWCKCQNIEYPDIVFVGDYKEAKNIDLLMKLAEVDESINILIVARGITSQKTHSNLFTFGRSFVYRELVDILHSGPIIGYVGHDNLSIATSIYLYSSFGLPMIFIDSDPYLDIAKLYNCGSIFSDSLESLLSAYYDVRSKYNVRSKGASKLIHENTWEKSALIHSKIFSYDS